MKIVSRYKRLKQHKIDLFALSLCIASYVLLYLYFTQKLMPSLFEWQDYLFHSNLTKMIIEQGNFFPLFQEHLVPYPPLFHHSVALLSYISGLSIEKSLICTACLAGCGFSTLLYLFMCEISKNKLAGLLGVAFLGIGANILTYFSSMIFFGRVYIIINYIIAGFLPQLLGHFFGILILFFIVKSNLESWYHVASCIILGILLILTHVIASVTYLFALLSILLFALLLGKNKLAKKIILLLFIPLIISSPWWVTVLRELMNRPYLFFLADAGKSWISYGVREGMLTYYGLLPILLIPGVYKIIKNRNISLFLIFWCVLIFLFTFSTWGFRFALELIIPLYVLSILGITTVITYVIETNFSFPAKLFLLFIIIFVIFDSLLLFEIIKNLYL